MHTFLGRMLLFLCVGSLLFLVWADRTTSKEEPRVAEVMLDADRVPSPDYLPLGPGRIMTYASAEGERFNLTFLEPVTIEWFDGTRRKLHPVHDQRCQCHVLLQRVGKEVRAIGSVEGGQLNRWGEYIVLLPWELTGPPHILETPAGRFDHARRYATETGTAWFAPGVGIIKLGEYSLVEIREPGDWSQTVMGKMLGSAPIGAWH